MNGLKAKTHYWLRKDNDMAYLFIVLLLVMAFGLLAIIGASLDYLTNKQGK